jgi:hypothetical protein
MQDPKIHSLPASAVIVDDLVRIDDEPWEKWERVTATVLYDDGIVVIRTPYRTVPMPAARIVAVIDRIAQQAQVSQ